MRKCLHPGPVCGAFSWLLSDVGGARSLWVAPSLSRSVWAVYERWLKKKKKEREGGTEGGRKEGREGRRDRGREKKEGGKEFN